MVDGLTGAVLVVLVLRLASEQRLSDFRTDAQLVVCVRTVARDLFGPGGAVEAEGFVLVDAGLEPHPVISQGARLVLQRAEHPPREACASALRHDVHAPDLGRPGIEAAHAAASHVEAVHRADKERAVRQREVRRGRLAPGSGPAVPLEELHGERVGQRPGRLAP